MNIPCILIPVLVGLICGILGYLLGKMNSKGDSSLAADLQADLDACKAHTKSLNTRISSLEADLAAKLSKPNTTQSFAASTTPVFLFDKDLAASVCNKKIEENDLKIVEGIGPKIETLMNACRNQYLEGIIRSIYRKTTGNFGCRRRKLCNSQS